MIVINEGFISMNPDGSVLMAVDRDTLNAKDASRKADREFIARALINLVSRHSAQVERMDIGPNPGYHGASITLNFLLAGAGVMIDIDNLHGGKCSMISWYNTEHPARNFTTRFSSCVGDGPQSRPHHKATSCPADWYSLAMVLDAGLCLAASQEAFEPFDL